MEPHEHRWVTRCWLCGVERDAHKDGHVEQATANPGEARHVPREDS